MHILEQAINNAKNNKRTALIPFLTAGFPSPEKFREMLIELDNNGADIIEIGVPFSDPVADGPVVEEASLRALEYGITLKSILDDLKKHKGQLKAKIVLMGYLNPFLQYGYEKLANDAKDADVHGFIIPDLPFEEYEPLHQNLKNHDIALIPLVGPNTSEERMEIYAKISQGYVYVVSIMGTTGARAELPPQVAKTLQRAKKVFDLPLALGFGLQEPSQLDNLDEQTKPDAVVFGSALLKHIDSGKSPAEFMKKWN